MENYVILLSERAGDCIYSMISIVTYTKIKKMCQKILGKLPICRSANDGYLWMMRIYM